MSAAALGRTIAALGDPTRRAVVELLREKPRRAGALAAALETSAQAMSRHLRVLREAGLAADESGGSDKRARIYRLRPEAFAALLGWVQELAGERPRKAK